MQVLLTSAGPLVLPTGSLDHLLLVFALSHHNQSQRAVLEVRAAALAFLEKVPGVVLVFPFFSLFIFSIFPVSLAFLSF